MRLMKNKKSLHYSLITAAGISFLTVFSLSQITHAAALNQVFVRFDRMEISTPTTGTVCAKPSTSSTDVKSWSVTFPTGYTVSTTAANWQTANISTTNLSWPSGGTAWPNATSATAAVSGQTVTWTNSSAQTMNNTTLYCYNWTSSSAVSVTSSASASNLGSVTTTNSSSATIDTAQYATASITNDQITVTATVPPAFSFALSANTDSLGTLSTASVSSSPTPRTITVNTNAKNGWFVWGKDSNVGLTSATASYTIPAETYSGAGPTTVTAGSEGYNTGVTSTQAGGSGTLTVDPGFLSAGAGQGGGLTTSYHSLATSTGSADTAVLTLTNNAGIKGSTPAASDYTDTITVVGAGLF